ncbi:hypothetical protein [Micromonospora sp. WMMC273]|uniref:hypothetical protein n=1 Tax=Micromonospora sp. WMMC273 TaxID=3015157 RepID=UPI0022B622BE|nr:hypothetical protein [Micromonospora sp. WMMC273]MCZ7478900.1 hypothetical protein [Micromonospora sp. WMMC273]
MSSMDKPYRVGDGATHEHYATADAAVAAAGNLAEATGHPVHVEQYAGVHDDPANRAGYRPVKVVAAGEVDGVWRALPPEAYVTVSMEIDNTYERYPNVRTRVEQVQIPQPPEDDDSDEYHEWAHVYVQCFTGVGHTDGNSWYDVTIVDSDRPELVGRTFEFGY